MGRGSTDSVRYRRAMLLLASAGGTRVPVIAQLVQTDEDPVRDVIDRFNVIGLACLDPRWAGGRPVRRLATMMSDARALALERFRWIGGHADVWQIFRDPEALAPVVRGLAEPFRDDGVTAVCGIESRGFLLGAAVAVELGVGFVAVRESEGIFPGKKVTRRSNPDYRGTRQELHLQRAAVGPGDRMLLVDDWIETGSQASVLAGSAEHGRLVRVVCGHGPVLAQDGLHAGGGRLGASEGGRVRGQV